MCLFVSSFVGLLAQYLIGDAATGPHTQIRKLTRQEKRVVLFHLGWDIDCPEGFSLTASHWSAILKES